MRSVREAEPVLIWPVPIATTKSAMKRVFGFARSVRDDRRVARFARHFDGFDCFCYGADLIQLDENCVADALRNSARKHCGIGDEQIVIRDELQLLAHALR